MPDTLPFECPYVVSRIHGLSARMRKTMQTTSTEHAALVGEELVSSLDS